MTQIAVAVEPLRTQAMDAAEMFARQYAAGLLAELEAAGWDAKKVAPYPKNTLSRPAYIQAQNKYRMVRKLTRWVNHSEASIPSNPEIVAPHAPALEEFAQEAREDASAQYSAFIAKLEAKVGAHTSATLQGNHVWSHSILTVETPQGQQTWKTQQIINVSKLGKVFNQWPTRQVK